MNVTVIVLIVIILIVLVVSGYVLLHHSTNANKPGTGMDCMGAWGDCEGDCGTGTQTYKVTRQRKGNGKECIEKDGATKDCELDPCVPPPDPPPGCEGTTGLSRLCCEANVAAQITFFEALKFILKPSKMAEIFGSEYKKNLGLIEDAMKNADKKVAGGVEKLGAEAATKTIEKKTVFGRSVEYLKGKESSEIEKFIKSGLKSKELALETDAFKGAEKPEAEAMFKALFEAELKAGGMTQSVIDKTLAKKAALMEADAALGPAGWALDGIMAIGMAADLGLGNKGFVNYSTTSELIKRRDEIITQLETQNGLIFPYVVGPLDAARISDPGDLNTAVVGKMFDILLSAGGNPTDTPNQTLIDILGSITTYTNDTDLLDSITLGLQNLPQDKYDALFDLAFDSLCGDKGGVLIDSGKPGYPKFCSYPDKKTCHDSCDWNIAQGSSKPDSIYTEWRSPAFFTKYGYQNIPATGACIMMDDTLHRYCNRPPRIHTWRNEGKYIPKEVYYDYYSYYTYNRETGVCAPQEMQCNLWGVGYDGVKEPDTNAAAFGGQKYGRCINHDGWFSWFKDAIMGETLPNTIESCLSSTGVHYGSYCNEPKKWCQYRAAGDRSGLEPLCTGNNGDLYTLPN